MSKRPILALAVVATLPTLAASADISVIYVVDLSLQLPELACLLAIPDGSGPGFAGATVFGGDTVDASFTFRLVDQYGDPVPHYPFEDLWLQGSGNLRDCDGRPCLVADENTDLDGRTSFSVPVRGGGWSTEPMGLFVSGSPAQDPDGTFLDPLPILVNSPDINGDGAVNLADIVPFTIDLGAGTGFRSDLVWDGVINLSDVVTFVQHLGASCE